MSEFTFITEHLWEIASELPSLITQAKWQYDNNDNILEHFEYFQKLLDDVLASR